MGVLVLCCFKEFVRKNQEISRKNSVFLGIKRKLRGINKD